MDGCTLRVSVSLHVFPYFRHSKAALSHTHILSPHTQTSVGISLLIALVRTGNEGGLFLRRGLAVLLYTNFLWNRAGHLPGLKVCMYTHIRKKNVPLTHFTHTHTHTHIHTHTHTHKYRTPWHDVPLVGHWRHSSSPSFPTWSLQPVR
jgi:hypothetical protein